MSQEHNALSWPGLEHRSSDLEPSALTTGPPDKAMALACLWYSWPHMLKVASCMVVRSYGRTAVWAYGRTTKFFWLDGLLLFCIIMGLHSASSAINHIFSCEWIRNLQNDPHKKLRLKKKHKKKSQAWTGFKLLCDRHKLNPYQSLEKASFPITILIAV